MITAALKNWFTFNRAPARYGHIAHDDFRPLLKPTEWTDLTPNIRRRFNAMHGPFAAINYDGLITLRRNLVGWFFAQACRVFGTPLPPEAGENIPAVVTVMPAKGGGIRWRRFFNFEGFARMVQSVKIVDKRHGLLEVIGATAIGGIARLGMRLRVYEEAHALHFLSERYFIKVGPVMINLPLLMTPGRVLVSHIDEGTHRFRFRLTFTHPWFGETFYQDGIFEEKPQ